MPDLPSAHPSDDLENRLDALGRALAAEQPAQPAAAVLAAMRARRSRRVVVARLGGALALAAVLALAVFAYTTSHARPDRTIITATNSHLPPSHAPLPASPTMAALRTLNQDATPETLRFPNDVSTSTSGPSTVIQPVDANDARSIARLLGSER